MQGPAPGAPSCGGERPVPMVSVVVPVRDNAAGIGTCLASILASDYPKDRLEVIAVDNGSTDGTADAIRAARGPSGERAVYVHHAPPGRGGARNAGFKAARGDIIVTTDSDARADPRWVAEIVREMGNGWTAVAGRVESEEPTCLVEAYSKAAGLLDPEIGLQPKPPLRPYILTVNAAFDAAALHAAGGFDDGIYAGEDVDVSWRLLARGARFGRAPRAVIWHRHRSTWMGLWEQYYRYGDSNALLFSRWRRWLGCRVWIGWRHHAKLLLGLAFFLAGFPFRTTPLGRWGPLLSAWRHLAMIAGRLTGAVRYRALVL